MILAFIVDEPSDNPGIANTKMSVMTDLWKDKKMRPSDMTDLWELSKDEMTLVFCGYRQQQNDPNR